MKGGSVFRIFAFMVLLLMLAAGATRAEILADGDEIEDLVAYNLTVNEILWWEEEQGTHIIPDMVMILTAEAADELLAVSENHVGEDMAFYFDGHYITSFKIMDAMADGRLRFRYESEAQRRLQPLLPSLAGRKKPVVRLIRTR